MLAALAVLCGCAAWDRDARFDRDTLLLYPHACFSSQIIGLDGIGALHLRGDRNVVMPRLVEREDPQRYYASICAVEPGITDVELLHGRDVIDSVSVEVAQIESLSLTAAQNLAFEHYPDVPGPVGLLVGRRAMVYVDAVAAGGRPFALVFEDVFDVVIESPVEVEVFSGGLVFLPMSDEPGVFAVEVVGRDEVRFTELVVVEPEAIERIEVAAVTNRDGNGGYSVTGVTADGLHILGLDVELTIDGVARESREGRWLFEGPAPVPGVVVVATWNGLEATLEE